MCSTCLREKNVVEDLLSRVSWPLKDVEKECEELCVMNIINDTLDVTDEEWETAQSGDKTFTELPASLFIVFTAVNCAACCLAKTVILPGCLKGKDVLWVRPFCLRHCTFVDEYGM
ncbi:hypothetical protein NDU88_006976 [Pleurodeles waltl]|uniref:Uncharacterized protein n=1 Tax=Pleurodeles waltl TaxID=8319 RepID=A0AAV7UR48_PLEWA|nr:hypothetical protein NDU88_006976 [Pleurodeles waltl]